jgi:hypothetical protein
MEGNHSATYAVSWLGTAKQQARTLLERAKTLGLIQELKQVLLHVEQVLRSRPLQWGDPLYHTQLQGGIVCRGTLVPVYIYYVVFESQRAVIIHSIVPVSQHPLAGD